MVVVRPTWEVRLAPTVGGGHCPYHLVTQKGRCPCWKCKPFKDLGQNNGFGIHIIKVHSNIQTHTLCVSDSRKNSV